MKLILENVIIDEFFQILSQIENEFGIHIRFSPSAEGGIVINDDNIPLWILKWKQENNVEIGCIEMRIYGVELGARIMRNALKNRSCSKTYKRVNVIFLDNGKYNTWPKHILKRIVNISYIYLTPRCYFLPQPRIYLHDD